MRRKVPGRLFSPSPVIVAAIVVALISLGVVTAKLVWPDGVPLWGHPQKEETLLGVWEGTYSTGEGRLLLDEDHSFDLDVRLSIGHRDITGSWTYSDGVLRLSPGLLVVYDSEVDALKYEQRPSVAFEVHNTFWPWKHELWLGEDTVLYERR